MLVDFTCGGIKANSRKKPKCKWACTVPCTMVKLVDIPVKRTDDDDYIKPLGPTKKTKYMTGEEEIHCTKVQRDKSLSIINKKKLVMIDGAHRNKLV